MEGGNEQTQRQTHTEMMMMMMMMMMMIHKDKVLFFQKSSVSKKLCPWPQTRQHSIQKNTIQITVAKTEYDLSQKPSLSKFATYKQLK